jgi:hypothetical protein
VAIVRKIVAAHHREGRDAGAAAQAQGRHDGAKGRAGCFGMQPGIELTGPGSGYVLADLRQTKDGWLLGLMNEHTEPALVSVRAEWLLGEGAMVKDLLSGDAGAGQGLNRLILSGDGYRLLHITPAPQGQEKEQPEREEGSAQESRDL